MRRSVPKFVLLVTLAGMLPVAAALLWAPACHAQQPDQHNQPGQTPAQQPATPPRPSADPDAPQESSSKKALPPPEEDPAPAPTALPKDTPKKAKAGVLPPEDDPAWDPFHAQQDIDVGMFYLHKGDIDAAISRFEHAISLRANFAKPRLLLAECYEKKDDPSEAVRYYKEYLQVLPNAPDAKKVREKIDKLSKK
ncbi:MAG: tetratricopeptide repeat protein [Candidatus Acidiferrales bacterium]